MLYYEFLLFVSFLVHHTLSYRGVCTHTTPALSGRVLSQDALIHSGPTPTSTIRRLALQKGTWEATYINTAFHVPSKSEGTNCSIPVDSP